MMKKFSLLLILGLLVCSSVFAGFYQFEATVSPYVLTKNGSGESESSKAARFDLYWYGNKFEAGVRAIFKNSTVLEAFVGRTIWGSDDENIFLDAYLGTGVDFRKDSEGTVKSSFVLSGTVAAGYSVAEHVLLTCGVENIFTFEKKATFTFLPYAGAVFHIFVK